MNYHNHAQGNSPEDLSHKTSLLVSVSGSSMSAAPAEVTKDCHPNQDTDQQSSELQDDSSFCTGNVDSSIPFVERIKLNRDHMPPWTIVVTRADLVGRGEVPIVESTNMGPVMHFSLSFYAGKSAVHVDIATEQSVMHNKPKLDHRIEHQPTLIKVGAWGQTLSFEHDFDGSAMYLFGEEVTALFVEGGKSEDEYTSDLVGPMMIAVFKDRPEIVKFPVDYVHLECKPVVTKSKYFQVF